MHYLSTFKVDLLNYEDGKDIHGRRSHGPDLEVARNAALALWSCSKSTRSRFVTSRDFALLKKLSGDQ